MTGTWNQLLGPDRDPANVVNTVEGMLFIILELFLAAKTVNF